MSAAASVVLVPATACGTEMKMPVAAVTESQALSSKKVAITVISKTASVA